MNLEEGGQLENQRTDGRSRRNRYKAVFESEKLWREILNIQEWRELLREAKARHWTEVP